MEEVIDLLCKLISIPSVSGEEQKIAEFVSNYFKGEVGIEPKIDEMYNVIVEYDTGKTGPNLLLTAHLDTVQAGSGWTYDPYKPTMIDDRIYGLGASDSKGTIAPMMTSCKNCIKEAAKKLKGKLLVALTTQEENPVGEIDGLRYALRKGLKSDLALFGNGYIENYMPYLTIGHNGFIRYQIRVIGKGAHSSTPELGINAIEKAFGVIKAMKSVKLPKQMILGGEIKATMNVGVIRGGTQPNAVPTECTIIGDRRTLPMEKADKVIARYEKALEKAKEGDPELKYEAKFEKLHDSYLIPEDDEKVQKVKAIMRKILKAEPRMRHDLCYYDADYLAAAGIPTIMIGTSVIGTPHQPNEYNLVKNVISVEKVYTALIQGLLA